MHPQHCIFFRGMAQYCIPGYGSDIFSKTQLYYTPTVQDTHAWMPHCKMVFDSLRVPLTSLSGADFLKAWLEVVKCMYIPPSLFLLILTENHIAHAVLWSRNIKFGDPNLWNAMYDKDLKSGVLVDYDFSTSRRQLSVSRSGTIPFMALDLLLDDPKLEVERQYRHELEAFFWILSFVFMRYHNGKSQRRTAVDSWMTSSYRACLRAKLDFMWYRWAQVNFQSDCRDHWRFSDWLLKRRELLLKGEADGSGLASISAFVKQLRAVGLKADLGYVDKLVDDLGLESLSRTFPT